MKDIYIYGEVLFDCFENGEDKLGGAPFNVAWNLKGFGLDPKIITSVGNDSLGKEVLIMMEKWGLDTTYVNILTDKKTGSVLVKVDDSGVPTYSIEDDCAYDYIDVLENIKEDSILYHGSLALRHEYNQKKCEKLKVKENSKNFMDINLREPWWNNDLLETISKELKWLKINDEELPLLCEALNLFENEESAQLEVILKKLNLELLILTKGSQGALLIDKNKQIVSMPIEPVEKMADTVGAGDAFASVVIFGLYNAWNNTTILKRAMNFASKVCELNGAITNDKEFYNNFLINWKNKKT